jgi:uncharacterized short protein YbdD (DUF466 family)
MRGAWNALKRGAYSAWQGLRQWSGDAAYETYARCATRTTGKAPLTREEFYVEQLNRKYSRPNRCC